MIYNQALCAEPTSSDLKLLVTMLGTAWEVLLRFSGQF